MAKALSNRAGSVLLETAVVIPLCFLLTYGIVNLGFMIVTKARLGSIAYEAARYGSEIPGLHDVSWDDPNNNHALTIQERAGELFDAYNIGPHGRQVDISFSDTDNLLSVTVKANNVFFGNVIPFPSTSVIGASSTHVYLYPNRTAVDDGNGEAVDYDQLMNHMNSLLTTDTDHVSTEDGKYNSSNYANIPKEDGGDFINDGKVDQGDPCLTVDSKSVQMADKLMPANDEPCHL